LIDVQISRMGLRPKNTFFGRLPVRRIDHVFVSPSLHPGAIQVPRTHLTRMASDHLPLLADLHPVASL
jgi:endonuclease/exonuclease/phosphatase family metal-dependent hydrolase